MHHDVVRRQLGIGRLGIHDRSNGTHLDALGHFHGHRRSGGRGLSKGTTPRHPTTSRAAE